MPTYTPAATTTTINSVCPKCGIIAKSGKISCCGRGGSWFKNCGSAGNVKLDHTWYEGIRACKARAQSKRAIGQQLNADHQQNIDSSNTSANGIITKSTRMSMVGKSTHVLMTAPVHTPADTSIAARGCGTLSNVAFHTVFLLVMIIQC